MGLTANRPDGRAAGWRRTRRAAWIVPATAAVLLTGLLCWGAWKAAHHPAQFYASSAWTHVWLRPASSVLALAASGFWLAAGLLYCWPRRLTAHIVGLTIVVAMVVIGGVLATAALAPCRGGQSGAAVAAWVLSLYTGQLEPVYGTGLHTGCPGTIPPALQLGRAVCVGATLVGATAAAAVLWRQPVGRMRARLVRDAVVLTGLDAITFPLLRRLTSQGRPGRVVVIEPDPAHPLLPEARATGARIMIADPTSARVLKPVIAGWRGCALRILYALSGVAAVNEAVLAAARPILDRYAADPERQPHLVARIDDPRHADHWRGRHGGTASRWFEDALSPAEATARALVSGLYETGAEQLLLCGDSTLALAILLELAHRGWEWHGLAVARAAGAGSAGTGDGAAEEAGTGAAVPVRRVLLLDARSEDLRREYLATSPWLSVPEALPAVDVRAAPWPDTLLAVLDGLPPEEAARTATIVATVVTGGGMHEAGRVARMHPDTPLYMLSADGSGISAPIFDQLRPFERGILVDGEPPEDTWTRIARHWHECYRLSRPLPPDDPRAPNRRPWAELDEFIREDNILQLRTILVAVAALGREWVPARSVAAGSFIELTDGELQTIARAEHTRWYLRRRSLGRQPPGTEANPIFRPWDELTGEQQVSHAAYIRSQIVQLEDAGFMPVVPAGGPAEAASFRRIGAVRARRLTAQRTWVQHNGETLQGEAGDWRVVDPEGHERTVGDPQFRASHLHRGGEEWDRKGVFLAWKAAEGTVVRTLEGPCTAVAGDWIVQSPGGERWPVPDRQFRQGYRALPD
jgi:Trk K+ transport system NAD-binding subunit